MGEDLFWAITGGGGSSFGVVLAYKIKLVRVPSRVTVFRVTRTYEENLMNIVYSYQQVADKLPEEIFVRMTLDVVSSSVRTGEKTNRATFLTMFLGDSEKLLSLMNETFPDLGLKQSDLTEMSWVESVLFWTNFPAGTPVNILLSRVLQCINWKYLGSDYDYQILMAIRSFNFKPVVHNIINPVQNQLKNLVQNQLKSQKSNNPKGIET
ncbi:FAD-binding Berberine family protein [Forsythia ovata]|uniref:FAD-binding Berberine family protein n=1 Tax=Forsythia ovata TaxID=205694 RepID=A0ABD1S0I8_9LAMI